MKPKIKIKKNSATNRSRGQKPKKRNKQTRHSKLVRLLSAIGEGNACRGKTTGLNLICARKEKNTEIKREGTRSSQSYRELQTQRKTRGKKKVCVLRLKSGESQIPGCGKN